MQGIILGPHISSLLLSVCFKPNAQHNVWDTDVIIKCLLLSIKGKPIMKHICIPYTFPHTYIS